MKKSGNRTRKYLTTATGALLAVATAVVGDAAVSSAQTTVTTQAYSVGSNPTALYVSQSAAGSTGVDYVLGFQVPTAIPAGGTVTLTAPAGTALQASQVKVMDATNASSASLGTGAVTLAQASGSSTYNQVTVALPAGAAAGDMLYIELNGVTNPAAGAYGGATGNFTISTSTSPAAMEVPSYQVTATPSTTAATIEVSTAAPGAASQYTIGDLQATSALGTGATLALQGPAGTVFPVASTDYTIVDLTNSSGTVTPTTVTGGGTDDVTLSFSGHIASGDNLEVIVKGVTNPVAGTYTMAVSGDVTAAAPAAPSTSIVTPAPVTSGYWLVTASGYVYGVGGAQSLGNMTTTSATGPVVGIAATPDGKGYWVVTSKGYVGAFGDATSYGDLPMAKVAASNIVAIAPTADGKGYWLVGSDGGMFAFGDATFHGSIPGLHIHVSNVVGMVASPNGEGYLVVGSDGGVFSFGSSHFEGSLPGLKVHVNDVRAILPASTGNGYVLVGSDGGAFVFGTGAAFAGSLPGRGITVNNIVGIALTPDDAGYYMASSQGTVYTFGDAASLPAPSGLSSHLPVVAIAGD